MINNFQLSRLTLRLFQSAYLYSIAYSGIFISKTTRSIQPIIQLELIITKYGFTV